MSGREVIARTAPRYVVTELEGFTTERTGKRSPHERPGLSVQVLDRAYNYRVVATWRSEDYGGDHERRRTLARHRAATRCAELNGESPPSIVASLGLYARCKNGHLMDAANTYWRKDGRRRCRQCQRDWHKRHRTGRSADLRANDLSPACPRCGDLCPAGAVVCAECGCRLMLNGAVVQ